MTAVFAALSGLLRRSDESEAAASDDGSDAPDDEEAPTDGAPDAGAGSPVTDGGTLPVDSPGDSSTPPRPSAYDSKADFFMETGMTPAEFVVATIDAAGGRLKQQAVIERTGWPKSTVSRLLADLEAAGDIRRIQIGREKCLYLPEKTPSMAELNEPSPATATALSGRSRSRR